MFPEISIMDHQSINIDDFIDMSKLERHNICGECTDLIIVACYQKYKNAKKKTFNVSVKTLLSSYMYTHKNTTINSLLLILLSIHLGFFCKIRPIRSSKQMIKIPTRVSRVTPDATDTYNNSFLPCTGTLLWNPITEDEKELVLVLSLVEVVR